MSEMVRDVVKMERELHKTRRQMAEHRHHRDPQWDLWTRKVNHYGRTEWSDHFRAGTIPTGFAWQGAPFGGAPGGAGGILDYSYRGTYLRVVCDASPHFLSRAVGSYADKWFVARVDTGYGSHVGIRCDDGTNNNYAEFYLWAGQNNCVSVSFTSVTGGGAAVTDNGPSVRSDLPHVLLLTYNNGLSTFYGYTSRESGRWDADPNHQIAIAWVPARIGLIFRLTAGEFSSCCDLFYNEFV